MRRTKQFIDVTFTVANVKRSIGFIQQSGRLLKVVEPAYAVLFFDRDSCGIDFPLKSIGPFEFLSRPELHGANPRGSPSVVTTRLECIKMRQTVIGVRRPALFLPPVVTVVLPIDSALSRLKVNS